MINEGESILLVGRDGKRFFFIAEKKMIGVKGLGVVDGSTVCQRSLGDLLRIGESEFTVLRPSISDLLSNLDRKAQIMIPKDSFPIPLRLNLGSGDSVIEAGVGSGALTLVLLKTVAPSGRVISYEVRKDHADLAGRNVSMSEHASCWELRLEDICTATLPDNSDAAMLDMPNPWDALVNVMRALRPGGYVGCFVPNANQLESTVTKMREIGLEEIVSFETLQREMVVHAGGVRPSFDMLGHTGYLAFGRKMRRD